MSSTQIFKRAMTMGVLGASLYGLPLAASSSLGGPPGRSDILKFRDFAIARKPSAKSSHTHAQVPNRANAAVSIAIVPKAAPAKPAVSSPVAKISPNSVPVHVAAPPAQPPHRGPIGYADVISEKQKAILQVRAEALEITPTDYDRLLTSDEKAHFQALIEERQRLVNEQ